MKWRGTGTALMLARTAHQQDARLRNCSHSSSPLYFRPLHFPAGSLLNDTALHPLPLFQPPFSHSIPSTLRIYNQMY